METTKVVMEILTSFALGAVKGAAGICFVLALGVSIGYGFAKGRAKAGRL